MFEEATGTVNSSGMTDTKAPQEIGAIIQTSELVDICPNCGATFSQPEGRGRRKKFCSERCRTNWNHKHPNPDNWKNTGRLVICPTCGKEFRATREYGRLRKYCSHACANRSRATRAVLTTRTIVAAERTEGNGTEEHDA